MFTVGIDTGGTFTDCFVTADGDQVVTAKVDTTPHDLTVCFANAVDASARAAGVAREEFLGRAEIIRFSSTIETNALLTRSGPKLGLIVSDGAEHDLYGAAATPAIFQFVPPEMVAALGESVGRDGAVERSPDPEEVNALVRGLLERGARILVVCLRNATANAANERAVHEIVDASYPRHYLGAVPVLLSTEISGAADDAERCAAAVVNAYMHRKLATSLYKAEDDLRRSGFRHPLLVVTTDGGVTRVAKTRALSTYQSGPTAGIHAAALLCRASGIDAALTADVGGTSTDVGVVVGGRPVGRDRIDACGVLVAQPSVELVSFGIGGGSIGRVVEGALTVGPESAGAAPGPACFGLGGGDATPTDAWLALGYLDPAYYLGGRKRLDADLGRRALEKLGRPLGLWTEETALAVTGTAEAAVAAGLGGLLEAPGVSGELGGRPVADLAVVAYGGGGGLLLPAAARRLGASRVILSRYSPVFSAFGVSTFDVRHRYETRAVLNGSGSAGRVVERLIAAARRDMRGEGFDADAIHLSLDVLAEDGTPLVTGASEGSLAEPDTELRLPSGAPLAFALSATCEVPKPSLPEEETAGSPDPAGAVKGSREIVLREGRRTAAVYARERLRPGHVVRGPAIIEASDTSYLVLEGMTCAFDRFGSGVLTEGG